MIIIYSPQTDVLYAQENVLSGPNRLDCVKASEQCMKEQGCSTKYRTMRQCVAGGKERNFSMVAGLEAQDECRSAMDALKQSPLYNCRCKRGMKKEKNCLRIYWGIYQTLQGMHYHYSWLQHSKHTIIVRSLYINIYFFKSQTCCMIRPNVLMDHVNC